MSDEEIDVLYNEILKLPKVERPITATTQCEINVNDLFDTIRAFRKIPDYNELIKDNRKKDKEIERLNNIINEFDKWLAVNLNNLEKEKADNTYDKGLKHGMLANGRLIKNKLQELKGSVVK